MKNIKLTEYEIKRLETIGDKNDIYILEHGNLKDTAITFDFEGTCIHNPLYDESRRFPVNPIDYYKKAFIYSDFMQDKKKFKLTLVLTDDTELTCYADTQKEMWDKERDIVTENIKMADFLTVWEDGKEIYGAGKFEY